MKFVPPQCLKRYPKKNRIANAKAHTIIRWWRSLPHEPRTRAERIVFAMLDLRVRKVS